jgi:hypothetical protein
MFRIIVIGALALSLAGCFATAAERVRHNLDNMVGHPVSELALKLGPPQYQFAAGQGTMAFQWERQGVHRAHGAVRVEECRLSVIARSASLSPTLGDWIIERWEYTGNACV